MDPSTNNSMQAELTKAIDNLHGLFDEIGLSNSARDAREASVYSALNTVLQKQLGLVAECVRPHPLPPRLAELIG